MSTDRRFSCRRCRFVLFDEEHLMTGHIQDLDYTLFLRLEDNYFLPEWIQQAIEEVSTVFFIYECLITSFNICELLSTRLFPNN